MMCMQVTTNALENFGPASRPDRLQRDILRI